MSAAAPNPSTDTGTEVDTIRYGIVGTGMMGVEHIENLRHVPGAEITALADPHPGSREFAAAVVGPGVEVFTGHQQLLDSGRCDAVVIASPNFTHREVLLDTLGRDVHVLVEKPLCTTIDDCRTVIAAAEGHPGVLWVGLEYRYMPPVARLVREVHDGTIGPLAMVAIREHRFPFLPKVNDWNRFNQNTGGTMVEKCCHFFDLMNLIAQGSPTRVMASGSQAVNHLEERYDGATPDILDNALVIVDYDNGVRASLDLCMFAEASVNQEEISAVGADGKAEAFLPSGEFRLGLRRNGRHAVDSEFVTNPAVAFEGQHHGSSYLEHLDFAAAIRAGGAPGVGLEQGLLSVAMGVAAQQSIATGEVITMSEVLGPA